MYVCMHACMHAVCVCVFIMYAKQHWMFWQLSLRCTANASASKIGIFCETKRAGNPPNLFWCAVLSLTSIVISNCFLRHTHTLGPRQHREILFCFGAESLFLQKCGFLTELQPNVVTYNTYISLCAQAPGVLAKLVHMKIGCMLCWLLAGGWQDPASVLTILFPEQDVHWTCWFQHGLGHHWNQMKLATRFLQNPYVLVSLPHMAGMGILSAQLTKTGAPLAWCNGFIWSYARRKAEARLGIQWFGRWWWWLASSVSDALENLCALLFVSML